LIVLTVASGAATLWFDIDRATFDEPLMFIAEFLFNLSLIFSAMMFLFLLPVTVAWARRKNNVAMKAHGHKEEGCNRRH
jgi:hypothetical protein